MHWRVPEKIRIFLNPTQSSESVKEGAPKAENLKEILLLILHGRHLDTTEQQHTLGR